MKNQLPIPETPTIPRIFHNDTEASLLAAINREEVYGFVLADVTTPDHVRENFGSFLFPPIVRRMDIDGSNMSEYMKNVCRQEDEEMKFNTLAQTYNCKQELLITPLVKLYMDRGMIISNVTKFIQYTAGRGLRPFVQKVVEMRTEAKKSGDDAKSLTAKLFGNSSYGKCGESVTKYRDTKVSDDVDVCALKMRSARFKSYEEILDEEGELIATEISSLPSKVKDTKPVHVSVAILQHAKLLFLRFMWFLFDHLEPGSFRSVYADTDR